MNAFANTVFSLLLGWVRNAVQAVWNSISSGGSHGFLTWLGDHWIWLVVFLCIAGFVLDYLVWIIRWRPYRLWRQKLQRTFHRMNPNDMQNSRQFKKGYTDGVQLQISERATQPQLYEEDLMPPPAQNPFMPPVRETYTPPPLFTQPVQAQWNDDAQRNRRSQRHDTGKRPFERLARIGSKLTETEDEQGLLDGLPPAVNKEEAFYQPVFPDNYPQQWPQPNQGAQNPPRNTRP